MKRSLVLFSKILNLKKEKSFFIWKNYYKKFVLNSIKNKMINIFNFKENFFFIIFSFIEKKICMTFLYQLYKFSKNKNYFFSFLLLQKNKFFTFLQIFKNIETKKNNYKNIGFIFFLNEFELIEFLKVFLYYKDIFFCYLFFDKKYFIFTEQKKNFLKKLNFFYCIHFLFKIFTQFLYYLNTLFINMFNNLLNFFNLLNNWQKLLL